MTSLPLGRFGSIGLAELNETAQLLTRTDRKYVLDAGQARAFVGSLDPSMRALDVDGVRQSAYETTYFDTDALLSFHMSALGRRRRIKVRTRSYLDSRLSFLEVKTRGAGEVTVKERIGCPWEQRSSLTDVGRVFAGQGFASIGQAPWLAGNLHETLSTNYLRTTLLAPDGNGRITIDSALSWELPGGARLELPELVIVETKSLAAATQVDRLLWRSRCRPTSVSKYATGLAALRPELPRNRWARLLRGPFNPIHSKELLCAAA